MSKNLGVFYFLIIPWKVSLSGEVGGYPQALLKVVNLQGMLDFHRNFHLSKIIKSRGRIGGRYESMHAII